MSINHHDYKHLQILVSHLAYLIHRIHNGTRVTTANKTTKKGHSKASPPKFRLRDGTLLRGETK